MHRKISTTQERRYNQEGWCRGKRRRLPNSWDDIPRNDWRCRSWKRHRSHQWKVLSRSPDAVQLFDGLDEVVPNKPSDTLLP